jgi:quercetin dioxygenase-like cupin family protein
MHFIRAAEQDWEDLGDGIRRQMLGFDEALMMVRVRFEPGAVGTLHRHPHRQVTYVEAGRFEVEIGGARQTLEAGDSFFVPPDVEHGVKALEGGALVDVFAPAREDFL